MNYIEKAKEMLRGWIEYSLKDLYACPDRPDLICYGSGYDGWGMQTHQKALAAFAVAATNNAFDTKGMSVSKSELLDISLKMFRFMLESHIEGSYQCLDGSSWGNTWISALGTERFMHAYALIKDSLTKQDEDLMRRVFLSESDWLLDHYEVVADPVGASGKNKPESNLWNGIFLHRTAMLYPESKRAKEYQAKGTQFLVNGISVSSDAHSDKIYDGRKVSQWHIGSNFFDSFSLDHHGYLNIGYMVICLSNIAMYHFTCKNAKIEAPAAMYHHAQELWQLIKTCLFEDGRLIRIGGDSRVRYCYCQDYVLPMLLFARDYLKDADAEKIEEGLIELFYREYTYNNDGSFLSKRCKGFQEISPIYYTRLEADRAVVLSMLIQWDAIAEKGTKQIPRLSDWQEAFHGACLVNGKRRFASWVWKGAEGPLGLCLPMGKSSLAEWKDNLAGEIKGSGSINEAKCIYHKEIMFQGGFLTFGIVNRESKKFLAEQQKAEISAQEKIVYAVLPDDATVIVMQYAKTMQRTYLTTVKGLYYSIPNDAYNDFVRTYSYHNQSVKMKGLTDHEKVVNTNGNWLNVDQMLGFIQGYGTHPLQIYRPGERKICIKPSENTDQYNNNKTNMLWCDAVCGKCEIKPHWADKDEVILDEGAIIIAGLDAEKTEQKAKQTFDFQVQNTEKTRSIQTIGEDNKVYLIISNFDENEQTVKLEGNSHFISKFNGACYQNEITLPPNSADILVLK